MSGWWRRNGWALPVAVVAFGLAAVPDAREWFAEERKSTPSEVVRPAGDGWAGYGGARVRLVRLTQAQPKDYSGRPVELPAGTTAWRAELEFDLPAPDALSGCTFLLRTRTGRIYSADPAELSGVSSRAGTGCMSSDSDEVTGPQQIRNGALFLLPSTEQPAAVQVTRPTLLPRFVELPPPTSTATSPS